ncbi:hypothetical protein B0H14DRAFT_3506193 [Mycena olivaceomarginata]|nr:hypothetical protein B0H14DRAFT_3506193 [Mycena olivaceomarginata]
MFSKMLAFALFTLTIAHTTPPSHVPMADAMSQDLEMGILPAHGLGFEGEQAVMTSTPCQGQKWGLGLRWRLESEAKSRKRHQEYQIKLLKQTLETQEYRIVEQHWERASRRGAELEALRERISQMNAECAAALKANEPIARPSAVAQIIQQRAPDDQDQRLNSPNHRKQLLPKRRMAARPSKIPYYRRDSEVLTTLGVASASGTGSPPLARARASATTVPSHLPSWPSHQSPRPFGRTMGAVVKVRLSVNPSPAPSEKENVEVV